MRVPFLCPAPFMHNAMGRHCWATMTFHFTLLVFERLHGVLTGVLRLLHAETLLLEQPKESK